MAVSFEPFKSFKASELVSQRGFEDGLNSLNRAKRLNSLNETLLRIHHFA